MCHLDWNENFAFKMEIGKWDILQGYIQFCSRLLPYVCTYIQHYFYIQNLTHIMIISNQPHSLLKVWKDPPKF